MMEKNKVSEKIQPQGLNTPSYHDERWYDIDLEKLPTQQYEQQLPLLHGKSMNK